MSAHAMMRSPDMCDHCDWQSALDEIDGALESVGELPERAEDFADSVRDRLLSIQVWIEGNEHVTDDQWSAIENMAAGIARWL